MLEKGLVASILEEALATGGDFSELFYEETESHTVSMLDGRVESANCRRRCGCGVRVLKGEQCSYAFAAGRSPEDLRFAARSAAALFEAGRGARAASLDTVRRGSALMERPYSEVNNPLRIALLQRGSAAARAYSPEISKVTAGYLDEVQHVLIANSEGLWAEDTRPRTRLVLGAVASDGTEFQTGGERLAACRGFEAYDGMDIEAAGVQSAKTAVTMLHAAECKAGYFPVVIDGGFGGVILHEACVHSLEATSVAKGNSEFCGKLGEKIASDVVSAVDDGTLPGEWGSISLDDEGEPSRRNLLIEKGVLKGYLIDKLGGRIMGMPTTGNARRESYEYAPTSRMTNTFFLPGEDDEAEMLRTMGEGLFAARMGGGSVNPLTGEFNFAVQEGYWVQDGKLAYPVRGASLIGHGAEVLKKIDRVGRNMWMSSGVCGSKSGSVPTNVGQPRIRVSGMTVGGKGGAM